MFFVEFGYIATKTFAEHRHISTLSISYNDQALLALERSHLYQNSVWQELLIPTQSALPKIFFYKENIKLEAITGSEDGQKIVAVVNDHSKSNPRLGIPSKSKLYIWSALR